MRIIGGLQGSIYPSRQNSKTFRDGKKELLNCCDRMVLERKTRKMPNSQKERLAAEAIDRWGDFQESLSSVVRGGAKIDHVAPR